MSRAYQVARPVTGPSAAAMKYDILSAIGLIGLHGTARDQPSMPRLALLVTARYNWRRNEVSMGQAEMAQLWGVSERTAKREVKFWTECGVLICTRPGVRGRVGAYRLNLSRILELSEPFWPAIGSDYVDRMSFGTIPPAPDDQNVVRLPVGRSSHVDPDPQDPWIAVKQSLMLDQPEVYSSWLADLKYEWLAAKHVHVTAPSRFVASYVNGHYAEFIERTLRAEFPDLRKVTITAH